MRAGNGGLSDLSILQWASIILWIWKAHFLKTWTPTNVPVFQRKEKLKGVGSIIRYVTRIPSLRIILCPHSCSVPPSLCFLTTIKRTALLYHVPDTMVLCFSSGSKKWTQSTIVWNHEPKESLSLKEHIPWVLIAMIKATPNIVIPSYRADFHLPDHMDEAGILNTKHNFPESWPLLWKW